MPTVRLQPDTLDVESAKFAQIPLRQGLFLNSVPKTGSHLLRNIVRMFVPVDQHYNAQFIQFANLHDHVSAFDPARPQLSWGHLLFADSSAIETRPTRHILLVRDPYDWVLARARFFVSDEFSGAVDHLRDGTLGVEQLLNLMIFGIPRKAPPLVELFTFNAVAWLGTGVHLVRYEELVAALKQLESPASTVYFADLFAAMGIALPDDWAARVAIGSDRRQSGTARENLTSEGIELPDSLPAMQRQLVDHAAPGLRAMLGYDRP